MVRRGSATVSTLVVLVVLVASAVARRKGDDVFAQQRRSRQQSTLSGFKERRPNIILFLTDDQDVELGSLNFMPRTLRLLRDGGAEFRNAYVTTPMCCPSRSSLLTGMYVHNHHVYTNNLNCSSAQWQASHETRSFATYLSNAGYRTGYFGKYLNKYNGSYIPPGWREWGGLIMNSRYYNYSINLNGKRIRHGSDYHKDYYPDLIANDSLSFLRQSKQYFSRKPVMLVLSFPAPHGPEDSAPQFSHLFFNVTTHHTPAYDYAPNPDKQWILQVTKHMQPIHKKFTDMLMTKRLQTLQSVDEAVDKICQELKDLGELDNTYLVYTSDHGYHLGQFGLVKGKSFPFEFDIKVPFLVRGPGIEPGTKIDDIVLNLDLAPTFLDIAGVETPSHMDGRSFLRLLHRGPRHGRSSVGKKKLKWPDTFLIESSGKRDYHEANLNGNASPERSPITSNIDSLEEFLANNTAPSPHIHNKNIILEDLPSLSTDSDLLTDNRVVPIINNKVQRLAVECQRPEFQTPCRLGQKWHCVADGNRWRKHKCKFQTTLGSRLPGKKCACFKPSGNIFTHMEHEERRLQRQFLRGHVGRDIRGKFLPMVRKRRRVAMDESWDMRRTLILNAVDTDTLNNLLARHRFHYRGKRDTSDTITDIMSEIEDEIISLKVDSAVENNPGGCIVSPGGGVNCTNAVYEDHRTWKSSRKSIDERIRQLKLELDTLKEIRRHLREKRPVQVSYDVSVEEEDDDGSETESDEETELPEDISEKEEETKVEEVHSPNQKHSNGKKKHRTTTEATILTSEAPSYSFETSSENSFTKDFEFDNIFSKENEYKSQEADLPKNRPEHHNNRHENKYLGFNYSSQETNESYRPHIPKVDSTEPLNASSFGKLPHHELNTTLSVTNTSKNNSTSFNSHSVSISNRKPFIMINNKEENNCYCEPEIILTRRQEKEIIREARKRLKEERIKRIDKKRKKKIKLENECLSEKMNCFFHDNEHWKTAPFWNDGPFCFCMNSNNNSFACLRTINETHNFLYCEFVTGLRTFYNLRIDPYEQWNRVHSLSQLEVSYLHDQLQQLQNCRGTKQCTVGGSANEIIYKKRKYNVPDRPTALRFTGGSDVPTSHKGRKKVPKPWRRHNSWNKQPEQPSSRQRRRRFRQYFQ